jgi:hypothetical protein
LLIPIPSARKTSRQIFVPLSPSVITNGLRKLFELIKACLSPWFSFGKSVITVYLPELCVMLLEIRISVRSRRHPDGRGSKTSHQANRIAKRHFPHFFSCRITDHGMPGGALMREISTSAALKRSSLWSEPDAWSSPMSLFCAE